ncbi:MerR family transcriptional regulator [Tumebacillus permanentifrigoris]|uniref:Methanogenic corrinoid protein MtbC1 n=1 Tax=Tumebacillus permanentifrigoris TaxID=378543 RepID=A0A316DAT5_9BACL|nr:MerR family transcriptional regulator [Tumebacillus permanentifrigoris]PWK14838.1 methanogenic corrinoid protein MtbC1 [Tumebacillus permanentifrigoris]
MYNIKSVSKLLEMPAVTIRAWERRYHVVVPTRSGSGHRLYSEQDIEDLRWLKVQTEEKGVNISQAVKMLEKTREQRKLLSESAPLGTVRAGESYESLRERLYGALTTFDSEQANQLLSLAFSMFHFEDVFHQLLAPLLHQIGDDWEAGAVTVAQEHFASHFIMQRFFQFFSVFGVNPGLPKVLAFCPSGEQHQIGLLLFTLFLRRQGVEVVYLGSNTPNEGLELLIERYRVDWICMSITDPELLPDLEGLIDRLRAKFPLLKFVLGGQGFQNLCEELRPLLLGGGIDDWNRWFQGLSKRQELT